MHSGNTKLIKQTITDQPAYIMHCYNTVFYQMQENQMLPLKILKFVYTFSASKPILLKIPLYSIQLMDIAVYSSG